MKNSNPKIKGLLWLIATVGVAAFFALGIPLFVRHIPLSFEESLARRVGYPTWMKNCAQNPEVAPVLNKVLQRIYPIYDDE